MAGAVWPRSGALQPHSLWQALDICPELQQCQLHLRAPAPCEAGPSAAPVNVLLQVSIESFTSRLQLVGNHQLAGSLPCTHSLCSNSGSSLAMGWCEWVCVCVCVRAPASLSHVLVCGPYMHTPHPCIAQCTNVNLIQQQCHCRQQTMHTASRTNCAWQSAGAEILAGPGVRR